jgi:GcrA cell cycle regulator
MTPRPAWRPERIEQMLALKDQGLSDYEVARKMGCSRTAVANKLSRMRNPRATVRKSGLWDEHRVALLTKLWVNGKSAAEVAAALNAGMDHSRFVSRNAVIGKVHRLGLSRPERVRTSNEGKASVSRIAATNRAKAAIVSRMNAEPAKPRPPKVEAVPLAAIESPNARPWMEREFGQCAWPLGEAGAIMSCCNPVSRGSWCEGHAAVGRDGQGARQVIYKASTYTRHERVDLSTLGRRDRPASAWDDARAAA